MKSFGELWIETHGAPIQYGGETVVPAFAVDLDGPREIRVKVLHCNPRIRQAVTMSISSGVIVSGATRKRSVICWYDKEPWVFGAEIRPNKPVTSFKLWNSWIDAQGGEQAWVGYSGMIVQRLDEDREEWIAKCSSRFGPAPDFDDFVIQFKLLPLER